MWQIGISYIFNRLELLLGVGKIEFIFSTFLWEYVKDLHEPGVSKEVHYYR